MICSYANTYHVQIQRYSDDVGGGTELGGQLFGVPEWHGLGHPFRSQNIRFAI